MIKKIILIILFFFMILKVTSQEDKTSLKFLDEYVFPAKVKYQNTLIGGLSGIDYQGGKYYIVADDPKKPRAYQFNIKIVNNKIDTVFVDKLIQFKQEDNKFLNQNYLDSESIIVSNGIITVSSEGSVKRKKDPFIFQTDMNGRFIDKFSVSDKFLSTSEEQPRHNGLFEGLSKSYDNKGFWSAMELPLESDGEEPNYPSSSSPVRFTYYDAITKKPTKEFAYELSSLDRPKKGSFNINGLTDILEYKKNHFFVIERTYQKAYKNIENLVKIYKAVITPKTSNVISLSSLKKEKYTPIKKELLFDFSTVRSKLTRNIIDNIEGITFGEKLPNGNRTLILVSDDNFQKYSKQLNQFVLLEISE